MNRQQQDVISYLMRRTFRRRKSKPAPLGGDYGPERRTHEDYSDRQSEGRGLLDHARWRHDMELLRDVRAALAALDPGDL